MGRIKTQPIKRVTNKLFKLHSSEFSKDFNENKKKVEGFAEIRSKKVRNSIAGYVTRLVRRQQQA